MTRTAIANAIQDGEEGHAAPALAALIGGAGAVVLGIGAANDSGLTAVIGGVVLGVGLVAANLLEHLKVDWDIYSRLEK